MFRPLGQRLFGVGTIRVHSSDQSMKDFTLQKIKNPVEVEELISEWVEKDRAARHISGREHLLDNHDFPEYDDDDYNQML